MDIYGLIGKRLGHSFSAGYFNDKFLRDGIDARYEMFEIPEIDDLKGVLADNPDLRGLNVTIPYKQDVIPMLDYLTDSAREIGAVNTIRIELDEIGAKLFDGNSKGSTNVGYRLNKIKLYGHNTDAPGFLQAIRPLLPVDTVGMRALVLGQGGASKAVIFALSSLGIKITKVSRRAADDTVTYDSLTSQIIREHKIIVNCTPLGMWPDVNSFPDIPYNGITPEHICFDLVYNPDVTAFMLRTAERGATVSNGLQMLYNQADLAWKFWNKL